MLQVQKIASFDIQGSVTLYTIERAGLPSIAYLTAIGENFSMPTSPFCSVDLQSDEAFAEQLALSQHRDIAIADIPIMQLRLSMDKVYTTGVVYAHYGLIRAGGRQFVVDDQVAASNDDYVAQVDFYAIDVQLLMQRHAELFPDVQLVQQISFDIAEYTDARRTDLQTLRGDNLYAQLAVNLSLQGQDLLINCLDTDGLSCGEHIAKSLGISDEALKITALVQVAGKNEAEELIHVTEQVIANPDYDDAAMHYILARLPLQAVYCLIRVTYTIECLTIGETIVLRNELVLTDEQIALLHALSVTDLYNGIPITLYVIDNNNVPVAGAIVHINDSDYITGSNGIVDIVLQPGVYGYTIALDTYVQSGQLIVDAMKTERIVLDTELSSCTLTFAKTTGEPMSNVALQINGVNYTTNADGEILLMLALNSPVTVVYHIDSTHTVQATKIFTGEPLTFTLYVAFNDTTFNFTIN